MIETWKEIAVESADFYIGWGGLFIGILFGALISRTNFCTMGSLSDIVNFGDWRRFRSWLMAAAVAMIGVYWLESSEIADMTNSLYVSSNLTWGGHIIGGLIFGVGMVFAGGMDGVMRVHDAATGDVLWSLDSTAEFATVNGEPTQGGSFGGGSGPVVQDGLVLLSSGYGIYLHMPGNLLLALDTAE